MIFLSFFVHCIFSFFFFWQTTKICQQCSTYYDVPRNVQGFNFLFFSPPTKINEQWKFVELCSLKKSTKLYHIPIPEYSWKNKQTVSIEALTNNVSSCTPKNGQDMLLILTCAEDEPSRAGGTTKSPSDTPNRNKWSKITAIERKDIWTLEELSNNFYDMVACYQWYPEMGKVSLAIGE